MTPAIPNPTAHALSLRDLWALCKPRVTLLVLVTGLVGVVAAPGSPTLVGTVSALLGIALVVAGANALNMYLERDLDAKMTRTRNRPLPGGRMSPRAAFVFGIACGVVAVVQLALVHNVLTAALAGASLVVYVWVYTPLKQRSWIALLVGAVPGAMPPLLGWTAMTGRIEPGALLLFAVLFFWQLPHFMAISIFRGEEYRRAGIRTVPDASGPEGARRFAWGCASLLLLVSLAGPWAGVGHTGSFVTALVLGVAFIALALRPLGLDGGKRWSRQLFLFSLLYLPLVYSVMAFGV